MKSALILALVAFALLGCTSRTLTISSEPPGAEVFLNREMIGQTPVTLDFHYGGVNEIILLKPEFLPAVVRHDTTRFFLDTPPFDILADLGGLHPDDHQSLTVTLLPDPSRELWALDDHAARQSLKDRAEVLRARLKSLQESAAPVEPLLPSQPPESNAERDEKSPPVAPDRG